MARVQYMSDLHLERIKYDFTVTKAAPTLILAGDIGRFCDYEQYLKFLARLCEPGQFESVLLVPGNHEFYGSSRDAGLTAAEKLVNEPSLHGKLYLLSRGRFDVPGTNHTILGCTLHSHIADGYTKLTNDFARIAEWTVKNHNAEHQKDLAWLKESLLHLKGSEPQRSVTIVTHYAPTFDLVTHPKNENNAVSQCFSSNALEDIRQAGLVGRGSKVSWIFGHTHWNVRSRRGDVVLLSNQLCVDDKDLTWWQRKRSFRPFDPKAIISV
ncbi:unnamed protein product [Zymoseptoria tritici ST99CH_1A5]|uniref:Calcineurin-like phosphoesterase domain-containing protein n=3 Tax=Zymoseptoria tritici TaxID=1047171 RepID=A0A1X7RJ97_ZYMT9|nr:unnamed protein product [Zymoseptoria tritici ST99CH_3D7]SMR45820.1 unnamed protein product [Zymoseptoria tritici ST99CH_1E4]SMR47071.1 unnamed protein product [Zymoseptoria tritici ST99CH_3D1]SMY20973.1 unnamed protein product [Zymoseptoria tritici ST99CH_1A5]